MNTADVKNVFAKVGELEKQCAGVRDSVKSAVAALSEPAKLDQRDVLAQIELFEREAPFLRLQLKEKLGLTVAPPVIPAKSTDLIQVHRVLASHHAYLTASLAAFEHTAQVTQPSESPAPLNRPAPSSPTLSDTSQSITELCRQHVANYGRTPLRVMGSDEVTFAYQSAAPEKQENQDSREGAAPKKKENEDSVPGAPVAGETLTDRCRAHLAASRKAAQEPRLTAEQAHKMTWTELCQAARSNAPASDFAGRDERYEAYRAGVKNS